MKKAAGKGSENSVEALISDLASKNGQTRQAARTSLVSIGTSAVPFLLPLLNERKHKIRWEAVKALAEIKDPAAIDGLILALTDEDFDVRWLAAEGLVALGVQVVVPLLQALTQMQESTAVLLRDSGHHILRALISDDLGKKIKPVLTALEDIDFPVKVPPAARNALKSVA
jgi:HEAT repeat protein